MSDPQDRAEALTTIRAFFALAGQIDAGDTEFAQLLSGMREALSTWWPSCRGIIERYTPKASP